MPSLYVSFQKAKSDLSQSHLLHLSQHSGESHEDYTVKEFKLPNRQIKYDCLIKRLFMALEKKYDCLIQQISIQPSKNTMFDFSDSHPNKFEIYNKNAPIFDDIEKILSEIEIPVFSEEELVSMERRANPLLYTKKYLRGLTDCSYKCLYCLEKPTFFCSNEYHPTFCDKHFFMSQLQNFCPVCQKSQQLIHCSDIFATTHCN
jgi:hypothetical protein